MQLVLERLGFADFQRAKSVCSSWHYCLLFNPEEKENKLYRIQNLGVNFANSNCLATYGSWLLMQDDHQYNILYILNIFTFQFRFLVYSRKGDKFWKQIEIFDFYEDMVYKDHKLYMYTSWSRDVKILDFSQDIPQQIFETQVNYDDIGKWCPNTPVCRIKNENLVVRVTGEVLRVKSIVWYNADVWYFRIYKLDSSNREWEKLDSLGDEEAIFLDLGITVLANTIQGVDGNSIYFSGNHNFYRDSYLGHFWSRKDIFIFNLGTQEIEKPHPSIFSSIQLSNARWFVPNFKQM
ncbi:hypothetical protein Bca52824_005410 [Brassica carinata]|uniref:KIB1-4 beta-propeller domain-containing protein n=1 Tax=Brassica carinata TaxID=52824 RepID=A0A8X7WS92_BRACI|nr:hypothetical protein Bca52824_005410 [Brassica carinata]